MAASMNSNTKPSSSNRPVNFSSSVYGRPRSKTQTRPATAMSRQSSDEDVEPPMQEKRNGMNNAIEMAQPPLYKNPTKHMEFRSMVRSWFASSVGSISRYSGSHKGVEGSPVFLNTSIPRFSTRNRVADTKEIKMVTAGECMFKSLVKVQQSRNETSCRYPLLPDSTPEAPHTPSNKLSCSRFVVVELATAAKELVAPFKSPHKPGYLTKESNVKGFTAWDVDERLTEFDTKLDVVKNLLNGSLFDRKAMEETLDFMKKNCEKTIFTLSVRSTL